MGGRTLSKSKILAYRQCEKRLWLEVHQPGKREDSEAAKARFSAGHQVGDIARSLYDAKGVGALLDPLQEGFDAAFKRTGELLGGRAPIFEAGFKIPGALAFADVMLPVGRSGKRMWRMVEVKSSTSVKDYHHDDAAIQAHVARASGVPLAGVAIACIDSKWIYPGKQDYSGLLVETDVTDSAFDRAGEVETWIKGAHGVVALDREPQVRMGEHCKKPFECGFSEYCRGLAPKAKHPLDQLPGRWNKDLMAHVEANGTTELSEVPDALLTKPQLRVKSAALSGKPWFDRKGAAVELAGHGRPAYFLDFETIQFAIPIWKGTQPYQQIPFQFSVHSLSRTAKVSHCEFLDLDGGDPSKALAKALIAACGKRGPVFAYNAGFEKGRIRELAARFKAMAAELLAIESRVIDLLPIAREYYYHPSQFGSWSIKAVLPALCPDPRFSYESLAGVQDGAMAMEAYVEAISDGTTLDRREQIRRELLDYCRLDTRGLMQLWSVFSGNPLGVE